MKYRIALAVATVAAAIHTAISAAEEVLYQAVGKVQSAAWEEGLAAEQAIINRAKVDLLVARERMEQANKAAQAALKAHPGRVEAVRSKVFG